MQAGKRIQNYVYKFDDYLGKGNFSKCYRGRHEITSTYFIHTDKPVAIKIIELNSLRSKKLEELLYQEIDVLKNMDHPNILKCYDVFTSNRNCYIVTEICEDGDLESILKKKNNHRFEEAEVGSILRDVYTGLKYLAEKNIVHRDLKVSNILVNKGVAKIADFGFALFTNRSFKDINIGSPLYMSPEGMLKNIYGPKTDVWAFGIMVFELIHGTTPFSSCTSEKELRESVIKPLQLLHFRDNLSTELKDLVTRCMEVKESLRPTIAEVGEMAYICRICPKPKPSISSIHVSCRGDSIGKENYDQSKYFSPRKDNLRKRESLQESLTALPIRSISPNRDFCNAKKMSPSESTSDFSGLQRIDRENFERLERIKSVSPTNTRNTNEELSLVRSVSPIKSSLSPNTYMHQQALSPTVRSLRKVLSLPTKPMLIFTPSITFKECVSLLHFCRLLYKYLNQIKNDTNEMSTYTIYANFLLQSLDDINATIREKRVKYNEAQGDVKERKLQTVTDEYMAKYKTEINLHGLAVSMCENNNVQTLEEILQYSRKMVEKYEQNIAKVTQVNNDTKYSYFFTAYLMLAIERSALLLEGCVKVRSYTAFSKYKELEEILNCQKDKFVYEDYVTYRDRTKV